MASGTPDLTAILQAAQSADAAVRQQAEQTLSVAFVSSPENYLASLAGELANTEKPENVRQIAGILLKNALDAPGADATKKVPAAVHQAHGLLPARTQVIVASKQRQHVQVRDTCSPPCVQAQQAQRWLELEGGVKQHIKQSLLTTLPAKVGSRTVLLAAPASDDNTERKLVPLLSLQRQRLAMSVSGNKWRACCEPQEPSARHTAALVLAKLAAIELPTQQWPDLVKMLLSNMSVTPPDTGLRQSTLQTLGYICEEMAAIHDDVLSQEEINAVLTAVVQVRGR